jgi:putative nucleotidyltransferase-like protein
MARSTSNHLERPDRFAWLLGPKESKPAVRFTREQIDPACAFMVRHWQVLPLMEPKFLKWIDRQSRESPAVKHVSDVTIAVRALARMQMLLATRFVTELEQRGVSYVLMKSAAASFTLYPEVDLRSGLDVDIGVPRAQIREAERIAHEQGFVAAAFDEENRHAHRVDERDKRFVEEQHYELACMNRRQVVHGLAPEIEAAIRRSIPTPRAWHETEEGELACYVTLDIHHGICLDISVDEMVDTARQVTAHGHSVRVPQPEWMMLQLIFKIYWEGVQRYRMRALYQYADVVRLIGDIQGPVATRLFELLQQYELEAAAYYVLRRVETDFGLTLGPELRDYLHQASIPPTDYLPTEVNDMGDMWPRLWGFR